MDLNLKVISLIIIAAVLLIGGFCAFNLLNDSTTYWENDLGYVNKVVYGNESSNTSIVVITGIHPRETLAIEPEIRALKKFAQEHNVRIINYAVTVTKNPTDYQQSRDNGESLVHDYVVPNIPTTNAQAVIISHSHVEGYGEGFYLATPAMDSRSVHIAETIANESDFNYFRSNPNHLIASSAILVSKPIADAGYPTFVYEIPENITEQDSTDRTVELLGRIYDLVK